MGRRKKEPAAFHREQIAAAAEQLFAMKGIAAATMDEIARAANYSKATLYVYFKNKEEIVGALVLESMKMLYERIRSAMSAGTDSRSRYRAVCNELVRYQEQFPFYFEIALGEINVDFDKPESLEVEKETFIVGERINGEIAELFREGMEKGSLRPDIRIPQTVFLFWASLAGVISIAAHKQAYIEKYVGLSRQDFLDYSFDTLYRSIQSN